MLLAAETDCLARNVYYESRNQPIEGQIAVAKVTLNRAEDARWPSSACAVVKQRKQFSWVGKKQPEPYGDAWDKAQIIAITAYILPDPTDGATHFHADYVSPYWAKHKKIKTIIGDHIFYA
jgi:spore germination cell wall hydrolase CwlJ-like protein